MCLTETNSSDLQISTGLAGARSCGWTQWWKCFHLLKRSPSWVELPRGLCPSPKKRHKLCQKCFIGVLLCASVRNITPVKRSNQNSLQLLLTATIFFLRGSMTRTFLSLQAVHSRLPLRLQLTLKITSGCMSSRLIMASPVPTFQMMIWLSHPKMDVHSLSATPPPRLLLSGWVYFQSFASHETTEGNRRIGPILSSCACSKQNVGWRLLQKAEIPLQGFRCTGGSSETVTCTEENVAGGRMPRHNADPFGVTLQRHHRLWQGRLQSVLGYLPDLGQKKKETTESESFMVAGDLKTCTSSVPTATVKNLLPWRCSPLSR